MKGTGKRKGGVFKISLIIFFLLRKDLKLHGKMLTFAKSGCRVVDLACCTIYLYV